MKRLKITIVILLIIVSNFLKPAFAYFKDYPPYKFEKGSLPHLETKAILDFNRTAYKSSDGNVEARLKTTDTGVDFFLKDGKHVLARRTTQEYPYPFAVYWVDLDGNSLKDFVIFYWWGGCGMAFSLVRVEIFLKKETGGYCKISFDSLSPDLEDFVDLNKDGKYEVIITDVYRKCKHTYYAYDIYQFRNYNLVNADDKIKGFPKFVQYTYKPNDKDAARLTVEERLLHTKEKNNNIYYEDVVK